MKWSEEDISLKHDLMNNDAKDKDGGNGNNDDGEVEHDRGDDDDDDDNDINVDVCRRSDDDDEMATSTIGRQRCDGNGLPVTCRMLASGAPPIRGNNQLMSTVRGGVDEGDGQFWGEGATEKGQGGGDKQPVWWYGMFALCARENWLALAKKIFFNA